MTGTHDPAGTASPRPVVYALGADAPERERLQRQADELSAHSTALLDRVEITPGASSIDVGCGPRGVLALLSDRVGRSGHVTGLDVDPVNVELAQEFVRERGLANVDVMAGDARSTGLPASSFDLAHTRTLLINVPDPVDVVAEMVRLVKPGGWVAALEPDVGSIVCYPSHPAWDWLGAAFVDASRADGADPCIGRRLPELLRTAGLSDVGVEVRAPTYPLGHSRRTIRADLVRSMRAKIVRRGLRDEQMLDEMDQALRAHLADPEVLVMPHLLFLSWGRKPPARA